MTTVGELTLVSQAGQTFTGNINNAGNVIEVNASTGSGTLAGGGTITGGTLRSTGGAQFIVGASANTPSFNLRDITLDGQIVDDVNTQGLYILGNLSMVAGSSIYQPLFPGATTVSGTGTLLGVWAQGGTVTLGSGITEQGQLVGDNNPYGRVINHGTLINPLQIGFLGTFGQVTSDGTIQLNGGSCALVGNWTNQGGFLRMNQGATLNIGGTFTWNSLGAATDLDSATLLITGTLNNAGNSLSVNGQNASIVLGSRGLIDSGTVGTAGNTLLVQRSISPAGEPSPTLRDVTISGSVRAVSSSFGLGSVELADDATFTSGSSASFIGGMVLDSAHLRGTGDIYVASPDGNVPALVQLDGAATLDSGITLHVLGNQRATLFGAFTNQGLITDDANAASIMLGGTWTNAGTVQVSTATLELGGTISTGSIGTINRSGSASIKLTANLDNTATTLDMSSGGKAWSASGATISGGTITCSVPGGVAFSGTLNSVAVATDLVGGAMTFNHATLGNVNISFSSLRLLDTNIISGNATLIVGSTSTITGTPSSSLTFSSGITTVAGGGYTFGGSNSGNVINQGTISISPPGTEVVFRGQNQGWIHIPNGTLRIGGASFSNSGTISLENNGTLNLDAPLTPWNVSGVVRSAGPNVINIAGALNNTGQTLDLSSTPVGSVSLGAGAVITGGTLTSSSGAAVAVNKTTVTLNGVTISGADVAIENTASLIVQNGLLLTGSRAINTIRYDGLPTPSTARILLQPTNGNFLRSDPGPLTIGAGVTIRNATYTSGTPYAVSIGSATTSLINSGVISAGDSGTTMNVLGSSITNSGSFDISNHGTLVIPDTTVLTNFSGQTLTGGAWATHASSTLSFGSAAITTNNAAVFLDGTGSTFSAINSLASNNGTFSITNGRNFHTAGDLANSGTIIIANSNSLLTVGGALNNTGTIDVSGAMVIDPPGGASLSDIASQVASGYAGGTWTGMGIESSSAASVAATSSNHHKTGVGFAVAGTLNKTTFLGQSVSSSAVLLATTFYGDANLDGIVNSKDFTLLAQNFNQSGKVWSNGDFNYDGKVNALDFSALASNYGQQTTLAPPLPSVGGLVPEPISLDLLGGAVLLLRRKRIPRFKQPRRISG
jgi:hypothetical protein